MARTVVPPELIFQRFRFAHRDRPIEFRKTTLFFKPNAAAISKCFARGDHVGEF